MREILINALRAGGRVQLGYFERQFEITQKESQSSVVTVADIESERVIIDIIRTAFPGHNIVSEECGLVSNGSEFTWVVDPLDGTSNFAAGIPWFGVLIAVLKGEVPVLGGAYLPVGDVLYVAEKGKGAYRNDVLMPALAKRVLKDSLVGFGIDFSDDDAVLASGVGMFKNVVAGARNIRSTNSLLDFLYVAEGRFGAVVNMHTMIWDIAAPQIIITEVGGAMKGVDGGIIRYSVDEGVTGISYAVVAGAEGIVEEVIIYS
jgi:myo-inositol-1(or 4)-monophosphatase